MTDNPFLLASLKAVNRNGTDCTYVSVAEGAYNVETGSTTNVETSYTVKMFKKHLKANQYNYPNLIGKDAAMFYLVNDHLGFTPAINDKITIGSLTYKVDSIQEHYARGDLVLYRLVTVKG